MMSKIQHLEFMLIYLCTEQGWQIGLKNTLDGLWDLISRKKPWAAYVRGDDHGVRGKLSLSFEHINVHRQC